MIIIDPMEEKFFHGQIEPRSLADYLISKFSHGNIRTQCIGDDNELAIQFATPPMQSSGGHTALSVLVKKIEDGIIVKVGQQEWFGLAASLGKTAFMVLHNPLEIFGRLDDLAQDIENLQLSAEVWRETETYVRIIGSGYELSEKLRRITCSYCKVANPVGEHACIACGAPLGEEQPVICKNCGFVINKGDIFCTNCGQSINGY